MKKKAKQIIDKLTKAGYIAYYAGGYVRDLLLDLDSDDIDIATNAPPETVQQIFPHTAPIGIAFGIVLVILKDHAYEVATFRKDLGYENGRHPTSVAYSSPEEDAQRRDFTINGMFFDPLKKEVIDYVGGKKDLKAKLIRAIGNPTERFKEDRLRMIRAVRMAVRFNFQIEEKTKEAILKYAKELFPSVAIERVFQELHKMAKNINFKKGLFLLFDLHLLEAIFPKLKGIKRKELEKRLFDTELIPQHAPTIAKLLPLFGDSSLEERIELCQYLKLSAEDLKYVAFYDNLEKILAENKPLDDFASVELLASPFCEIALECFAIRFPLKERKAFLESYFQKKADLKHFIERKQNNEPVVKAKHLMKAGITPSPLMGELLKEAEKIAINSKNENTDEIVALLKKSTLWPKTE